MQTRQRTTSRKWTNEDDLVLAALWNAGVTERKCAQSLARTEYAVAIRRKHLGLIARGPGGTQTANSQPDAEIVTQTHAPQLDSVAQTRDAETELGTVAVDNKHPDNGVEMPMQTQRAKELEEHSFSLMTDPILRRAAWGQRRSTDAETD